jgi:hypothetical protein
MFVLDPLMGFSLRSENLGIMSPMGGCSMGIKKLYFVNNMVVVNHHESFIYLDVGYPSSFHDVTILHQSDLYKN